LLATLCGFFVAAGVASAPAQGPVTEPTQSSPQEEAEPGLRLVEQSGSGSAATVRQQRTAAQLRQARAWERYQQRVARIEAAKDAGYHLSRPPAVAVPSMTGRYPYTRSWIVPIYGYPRY